MIPIERWNVHDCFRLNKPQTNNEIKGWHREFQVFREFQNSSHPPVLCLSDYLKKAEALALKDIGDIEHGADQKKSNAAQNLLAISTELLTNLIEQTLLKH